MAFNGLRSLLDPSIALPMAGAMMSGPTTAQGIGNAFTAAGEGFATRRDEQKRLLEMNKTFQYLQQTNPELAQMVQAGMPVAEAWKMITEDRKLKAQAPNPPDVKEFFDENTGQPYKAQWNPQNQSWDRIGGIKAPSGMQVEMGPDGQFTLTQGPLGKKGGNVDQNKNAAFLIRGRDAHRVITQLEDAGTSLWNKTMNSLPMGVGNYGLDPNAQKFEQAKRDFVNAVLRKESGAVISDQEFANAEQQYFPQPGDSPEVVAQKRQNRENAIRGFEIGAGPAAEAAGPRRFRYNMQTGMLE